MRDSRLVLVSMVVLSARACLPATSNSFRLGFASTAWRAPSSARTRGSASLSWLSMQSFVCSPHAFAPLRRPALRS